MLADDHDLVLAGLKALLLATGRVDVVGEAAEVPEALELAQELAPDVVLMDYDFGRSQQDGLDALAALRRACPQTKVVMLTQYGDHRIVVDAVRAGAAGYVLKTASRDELVGAIEAAHRGRVLLSPEAQQRLADEVSRRVEIGDAKGGRWRESLTPRELEVLELVCDGLANKTIAHKLNVSVSTVKAHLNNVFEKFGIHDRTHLAVEAVSRGVVTRRKE
jgi:DNA-binding NarL/FixJ family response regulator